MHCAGVRMDCQRARLEVYPARACLGLQRIRPPSLLWRRSRNDLRLELNV
jgi:hypothetical protein